MAKKSLTINDIKTLVKLNNRYQEAKEALDIAKAELVPASVLAGKYFEEGVGSVNKVITTQTTVDYKKLLEDHPEIDIEEYTTYHDSSRIYIKNPSDDDKALIRKVFNI